MKHNHQPDNLIRQEIDVGLSFLDERPSLHNDIMRQIEGEKVVKKKISLGLVLATILVLLTATAAVAATYRGVSWFLTERNSYSAPLDENYLITDMEQNHRSQLLSATVVDAYWDGLELSIVYHVAPVNPAHTIRMECDMPEHTHYAPDEEADILLLEPDFINVTSRTDGTVTRPLSLSTNWVYEEDGSLSVLVSFPHYDMSQSVWISIPIFTRETATGQLTRPMLHCDPTTLADPIQPHEHDWTPATCVSMKVCTICQRSEGELGYHDYVPAADRKSLACSICGSETHWPVNVPDSATLLPGESSTFVLAVQLRLGELGYYADSFTGVYTPATTAAVQAWQESQGLEADGICHSETLQKLFPWIKKSGLTATFFAYLTYWSSWELPW